MKILAIETSADETGVAVLAAEGTLGRSTFTVLGNALLSQAHKHSEHGGIFPSLARREHAKNLLPLLTLALKQSGEYHERVRDLSRDLVTSIADKVLVREAHLAHELIEFLSATDVPHLDAITVTQGPGLEPALWVGISFAKALSEAWNIPLVPTNHLEGHLIASLVEHSTAGEYKIRDCLFPAIGLIISGGHTELILIKDWLKYESIGTTRDDAVGEAFDKVARMLGLPYPGGPHLSNFAEEARTLWHRLYAHPLTDQCELPRPMLNSGDSDFSFSGLKTAVLYLLKKVPNIDDDKRRIIAKEFEDAVRDVLVEKTRQAIVQYSPHGLLIGGGVSANQTIREAFENLIEKEYPEVHLYLAPDELTTDNAVMIGMAGYFRMLTKTASNDTTARGRLPLYESVEPTASVT